MAKNLDKETEKIFTTGEHLKALTESTGWAIAREMLLKKIAAQLNIASISSPDPATIVQLIGIRQETAKTLMEWMKEIEGTVEQHISNSNAFTDVKDSYILNVTDLE